MVGSGLWRDWTWRLHSESRPATPRGREVEVQVEPWGRKLCVDRVWCDADTSRCHGVGLPVQPVRKVGGAR